MYYKRQCETAHVKLVVNELLLLPSEIVKKLLLDLKQTSRLFNNIE